MTNNNQNSDKLEIKALKDRKKVKKQVGKIRPIHKIHWKKSFN